MKGTYLLEQLKATVDNDNAEALAGCLSSLALAGDAEIAISDWLRLLRQKGLFPAWSSWLRSEAGNAVRDEILREYRELVLSDAHIQLQRLLGNSISEGSWFDELLVDELTGIKAWFRVGGQALSSFDIIDQCCGRGRLPEETGLNLAEIAQVVSSAQGTRQVKFRQLLLLANRSRGEAAVSEEYVHWVRADAPKPEDFFIYDGHLIAIDLFYQGGRRLPEGLLHQKAKDLLKRLPGLSEVLFERGKLDAYGRWQAVPGYTRAKKDVCRAVMASGVEAVVILDGFKFPDKELAAFDPQTYYLNYRRGNLPFSIGALQAIFLSPSAQHFLPTPPPRLVVCLNRKPTEEMIRDNPGVLLTYDENAVDDRASEDEGDYHVTHVLTVSPRRRMYAATIVNLMNAQLNGLISMPLFQYCEPICRANTVIDVCRGMDCRDFDYEQVDRLEVENDESAEYAKAVFRRQGHEVHSVNAASGLILINGAYVAKDRVCSEIAEQLKKGSPVADLQFSGQPISDFEFWRLSVDGYFDGVAGVIAYKNSLRTEPEIARIPQRYFIELDGWIYDLRDVLAEPETYHLNAKNGDNPFSEAARKKIFAHLEFENCLPEDLTNILLLDGYFFDVRRFVNAPEDELHLNPNAVGATFSPEALKRLLNHPAMRQVRASRRFIVELDQVPTEERVNDNPSVYFVYADAALCVEDSDGDEHPKVKSVHCVDAGADVAVRDIAFLVATGAISMAEAWEMPNVRRTSWLTGVEDTANGILTLRSMVEVSPEDVVAISAFSGIVEEACFVDRALFSEVPLSPYALYVLRCSSDGLRAAIKAAFHLEVDLGQLARSTVRFVGAIPKKEVFFLGGQFWGRRQAAHALRNPDYLEWDRHEHERQSQEAAKVGHCVTVGCYGGALMPLASKHGGDVVFFKGYPCTVESVIQSILYQAETRELNVFDMQLCGERLNDYDVWILSTDKRFERLFEPLSEAGSYIENEDDSRLWDIKPKDIIELDNCLFDCEHLNAQAVCMDSSRDEAFSREAIDSLSRDKRTQAMVRSKVLWIGVDGMPDMEMMLSCPDIGFCCDHGFSSPGDHFSVEGIGPMRVFSEVESYDDVVGLNLAQRVSEWAMPVEVAIAIIGQLVARDHVVLPWLDGKAESLEILITSRAPQDIRAADIVIIEGRFIDRQLFAGVPLSSYAMYVLRVCGSDMRKSLIKTFELELHPSEVLCKKINFGEEIKLTKQQVLLLGDDFCSQEVLSAENPRFMETYNASLSHEDLMRAERDIRPDYVTGYRVQDGEAQTRAEDIVMGQRFFYKRKLYEVDDMARFFGQRWLAPVDLASRTRLLESFYGWRLRTDHRFVEIRLLYQDAFIDDRNPVHDGVMETYLGIPIIQIPEDRFLVLDNMVFDVDDLVDTVNMSGDPLVILKDPSTGANFSEAALSKLRAHEKTKRLVGDAELALHQKVNADTLCSLLGLKVLKRLLVAAWALDHDHREGLLGNERLTTEVAFAGIRHAVFDRVRALNPGMEEEGIAVQVEVVLSERIYYQDKAGDAHSFQLEHVLTGEGHDCTAYAQRNLWVVLNLLAPDVPVPKSIEDYWVAREGEARLAKLPDFAIGPAHYQVTNALAHIEEAMKAKYGDEWPDEWPDACPLGNVEAETYAFATTLFENGVIGDCEIVTDAEDADEVGAGAAAAMP